jgi:Spy/CpxP family protein refolding chaperone
VSPVTRTRILVVLSFLIAFAAGVSLGAVVKSTPPRHQGGPRGFISEQLHLTSEQQKQMSEIWSGLMQQMRTNGERRRALQTEREDAVRALMNTPELQKQYDAILQDYAKKLSDLAQEGGTAREDARKKTLEILTEPQRTKFEEIMKSQGTMRQRGEEHGWGRRGQTPEQGPAPAGRGAPGD